MNSPRNATTTARGRSYRWRDETFDSVTTIISGGVPRPALKAWGERLVAETAVAKASTWAQMEPDEAIDWLKRSPWRETDRAAVAGSDIHAWAERWTLGLAPSIDDLPEAQRPYAAAFAAFVSDWHPCWEMSEATVYNRRYGYAGTLDAVVNLADRGVALIDFKTGKGVYGEVALQLAAYRYAEFVGLADGTEVSMPEVDWCGVLHLTPNGYELIPVQAGAVELRYFLYAQQVRIFAEAHARSVLGTPLVPSSTPRMEAVS